MSFETFLNNYIECLLWSETDFDAEGNGDENFEGEELAPEALADVEKDCKDFFEQASQFIGEAGNWAQAGHDFCLTRNGHGAGFWDGDWDDELGAELTKLSKVYGTQGLYRGDDGLVYTHN